MSRSAYAFATMAALIFVGCEGPGTYQPIHLGDLKVARIRVITAAGATFDGPVDPKDRFSTAESVCVYSTFRWRSGSAPDPINFAVKCYRDGALITTSRHRITLETNPWNQWVTIPARALGPGKCRIDVCANDQVLDSHDIEIVSAGS